MTNLFDLIEDAGDGQATSINELRLGAEPATVIFFTADVDAAPFHFESDEPFNSYVICPRSGCPICFLGTAAQQVALLAVYNLETRAVEVLRIPTRRSPGSLATILMPLLKDPAIGDKVVLISRNRARYTARSQPLSEDADHGEAAIAAFVEAQKAGLTLASAFPQPTAAELAEVERIRRKLEAVGGYKLPATPAPDDDPQ